MCGPLCGRTRNQRPTRRWGPGEPQGQERSQEDQRQDEPVPMKPGARTQPARGRGASAGAVRCRLVSVREVSRARSNASLALALLQDPETHLPGEGPVVSWQRQPFLHPRPPGGAHSTRVGREGARRGEGHPHGLVNVQTDSDPTGSRIHLRCHRKGQRWRHTKAGGKVNN